MYGLLQFVYIFEIIGELSTLLSHFSKVKKLKIHLSRLQHFADRTLQNSGDDVFFNTGQCSIGRRPHAQLSDSIPPTMSGSNHQQSTYRAILSLNDVYVHQ